MLRGTVEKTNKKSLIFSKNVPWEIYSENEKYWFFRCGIQYWMNNAGKSYAKDKALKKKKVSNK